MWRWWEELLSEASIGQVEGLGQAAAQNRGVAEEVKSSR